MFSVLDRWTVLDRRTGLVPSSVVASLALIAASLLAQPLAAAEGTDLAYLLGPERTAAGYDPEIPRPSEIVGFGLGERHLRPDQIERWAERLADASPRVRLERTGTTHEFRPLLLLTITSKRNQARIDEIERRHRALRDPSATSGDESDQALADLPAVVYLGYSIHGNEASGSNAAPAVAYHLAASEDPAVEALLDDVVVLLDPMMNPDGLARFAHWTNTQAGLRPSADPWDREHRESWPRGRTNHYGFDLNRDWLLARQPESRARLATFHRWYPNVLADFHEMGSASTFFFQPGVASRQNPLTSDATAALTQELATFHARALDRAGSLYFTGEIFDDFYYGKGSTYPDIHGAVGILFEQASARGLRQESPSGEITFAFAVRNQVIASFSTLEGARAMRPRLLAHQQTAARDALAAGRRDATAAWVVGADGDPETLARFVELLDIHRIEHRPLRRAVEAGGHAFAPGEAIAVPAAQAQHTLVQALFERRTSFEDTTFYDVSAWTMPLAFGLPTAPLGSLDAVGDSAGGARAIEPAGAFEADPEAIAYAFSWRRRGAPRLLRALLDEGVRLRAATGEPLGVRGDDGEPLGRGAILVPLGAQTRGASRAADVPRERIEEILAAGAREEAVDVVAVRGGLLDGAVDLGSPSFSWLEAPRIALVVGEGVDSYEAGALWHLLDIEYGFEITRLDRDVLERAPLSRYDRLIFPSQDPPPNPERLRAWVRDGGVVIATRRAAAWAHELLVEPSDKSVGGSTGASPPSGDDLAGDDSIDGPLPYAERRVERDREALGGAILEIEVDRTHPLAFGLGDPPHTVLRQGRHVLEPAKDRFATVASYAAPDPSTNESRSETAPLVAGYASDAARAELAGSPAIVAEPVGRGAVIRFADALGFRAIWLASDKYLANALFFGGALEPGR